MHALLVRQLREAGLNPEQPPAEAADWQALLRQIDKAYQAATQKIQASAAPVDNGCRAVLESLADGVCAFDKNGKLLLANPAALAYLGLAEGEVDSEALLARLLLRDPWQPERTLGPAALRELLAQGGVLRDPDARLLQGEGHPLPISCAITPLVRQQHVRGAVLVFRDISAQKAGEKDLIAAKEAAEKASSAKSEFLSAMSHELRTPMNAILGYAGLLQEDLQAASELVDPGYVEDFQYYTDHILEAGQHLLGLINQVLDLSRIEAGKLQISVEKVDLLSLLDTCVRQIMPEVRAHGLTLENRLSGGPPVFVLADVQRLKQVLLNLLSNAVKYNREQGGIVLELVGGSGASCVRLLVKDTGIGMSAEQQAQVFKPFVRLSGKNLSKGTGVGLTIVKDLLDLMDGRIGVESRLEVGSTFWIELPGVPSAAPAEAAGTLRKYLLLYIEDSRTNVGLVTKILRVRPDIGFISAPTGELGVELARAHRPDAILLDINLPGIDGFEVLRRLRAAPETQEIPVLGLSADDSHEALDRAKAAGFFHYIVKPLDRNNFLDTLGQIFE